MNTVEIIVRGYCRTDSSNSTDPTPVLEEQQQKIATYCKYRGYKLAGFYTDVETSGKNMIRPGLQKMVTETKAGETVIFSDLRVFSEIIKDTLALFSDFKQRGIGIICVNPDMDFQSPIGTYVFNAYMILNDLEKKSTVKIEKPENAKVKNSRTRAAFGYRYVDKNKDFEEVPEQMKVVQKILTMYKANQCYNQIATQLNTDGDNYTLPLNKKTQKSKVPVFTAETVKRILTYYGAIADTYNRTPLQNRIKAGAATQSTNSGSASTNSKNIPTVSTIPVANVPPAPAPAPAPTATSATSVTSVTTQLPTVPIVSTTAQKPPVASTLPIPTVQMNVPTKFVTAVNVPISIPITACSSDDDCDSEEN